MKKSEIFIMILAGILVLSTVVFVVVRVNMRQREIAIQSQIDAGFITEDPVVDEEPLENAPVEDVLPEDEPIPDVVEETEDTVEEDSYTEPFDPYGMYKVPEEWAAERGGLYVERDTGIYTLQSLVPRYNLDNYTVGYSFNSSSTEDVLLYIYDDIPVDDPPTATTKAILSSDDFPILQVNKGEELHYYGDADETMTISKTNFVGYSIPACRCGLSELYVPIDDHVYHGDTYRNNIGVFDMDENPVSDVRDLEYGRDYKYEWYEGTEYHELKCIANCRCYDYKYALENKIEISGKLTKFGYVAFDISNLEPGIYTSDLHSVFEVVE